MLPLRVQILQARATPVTAGMAKSPYVRMPYRARYTESAFRPYLIAVGQVAMAANDLADRLSGLFWTITGGGFMDVPLASWNALPTDRIQQKMLRDTIGAGFPKGGGSYNQARFPTAAKDLDWLLAEAGKVLSERNNVVHCPVILHPSGTTKVVMTQTVRRNPQAIALQKVIDSGRDLLTEIRWYRDKILVLRDYCWLCDDALCRDHAEWPKKPRLPSRPPTKRSPSSG
jgi:hypothetical protein